MRIFLFAAMLGCFGCLSATAHAEPVARNVIFICADDLNNELGCYGDELVQSPHIDRLADRGVRFDRAYCQYPVCQPSRVSMLSGLQPGRTGVIDNVTPTREHLADHSFLPQYFRQHGYRTIMVGKIFHANYQTHAYEDAASWDIEFREDATSKSPPKSQIAGRRGRAGIVLDAEDEDTWDGFVARKSIELLEKAAADDQPFFLAVGFRRPHTPYIAPRKYHDLYPASAIPPIDEPAEHLAGIPEIALTHPPGEPALSAADRPETAAAYYASVTFFDAQLGLLLDAIDRLDLWDDTVVLFVSDHGYHLGEHGGLWHKMTLFENSARVPLVVAAPGMQAGAASPRLVELVDLYPTLVELCGLPTATDLDGRSFAPQLADPQAPGKDAAFTVVSHSDVKATVPLDADKMGRSVRTERYRYTEWFDGSAELYDYERDPNEWHNLAGDPQHAETVARLRKLLDRLPAPPK